MGNGLWVMGYGLWVMGYGLWVMGNKNYLIIIIIIIIIPTKFDKIFINFFINY